MTESIQDKLSPTAKSGVLSLSFREKSTLYAAYMPFLKGGGIFIPSAKSFALGDEVFVLLSLLNEEQKYPVQGRVVWVTPDGANNNRPQGIGIEFSDTPAGMQAKIKIEQILGGVMRSTRHTHTM